MVEIIVCNPVTHLARVASPVYGAHVRRVHDGVIYLVFIKYEVIAVHCYDLVRPIIDFIVSRRRSHAVHIQCRLICIVYAGHTVDAVIFSQHISVCQRRSVSSVDRYPARAGIIDMAVFDRTVRSGYRNSVG